MDKLVIKICEKHGKLFTYDVIRAGKNRNGFPRLRCKKCMKALHRENYLKNKVKIAEKCKKYREENKDKIVSIKRKWEALHRESHRLRNNIWRKKHPEIERERNKKRHAREKETLGDYYMRKLLTHRTKLSHKDISKEMVEVKRSILKIKRKIDESIKKSK